MQTLEGFDFQPLTFDDEGKLTVPDELKSLTDHLNAVSATDAILFAHGFRNSEADALGVYSRFLKTFREHVNRPELKAALAGRRIVAGGFFWPSKPFREVGDVQEEGVVQGLGDDPAGLAEVRGRLEEFRDEDARPDQRPNIDRAIALLPTLPNNPDAQDEFVDLVMSLLDNVQLDGTEGLDEIRSQSGSELLDKLAVPIIVPAVHEHREGVAAALDGSVPVASPMGISDLFTSITGRVGQLLNLTTWYMMKGRCGKVGAAGGADVVRAIKRSRPAVKVHLVGHSLGARLMAATAKSLCSPPPLQADSLTLLEAAFSHYGFSADNGHGSAGFFRDVVAKHIVKGPFVSTFSFQDAVVQKAYAIASRLALDNTEAVGDASDPFGGLGRNGTQRTSEAVVDVLHEPGTPYDFKLGVVNNLDGSGGLIKDHSDVTNPMVTYAFASALART
jgi:hypothetical protein